MVDPVLIVTFTKVEIEHCGSNGLYFSFVTFNTGETIISSDHLAFYPINASKPYIQSKEWPYRIISNKYNRYLFFSYVVSKTFKYICGIVLSVEL